jgi:hypothetical protein
MLDAADYPATWRNASVVFKGAVTSEAWGQAAQSVRAQFGPLKTRTEQSASFTRTLPGAPDGEYVVIQFNTTFEKKSEAVETVIAKLDPDGIWKVAGYFIR